MNDTAIHNPSRCIDNPRSDRPAALTELLHRAPDNADHVAVREYVRDLANAGLAVLFVYPESKLPWDGRTAAKRRSEDKTAREAARAAGDPRWGKAKSPSGVALATTDPDTLDAYLDRYVETFSTWADPDGAEVAWTPKADAAGALTMVEPVAVNLAVAAGPSGLVIVDADTAGQVACFTGDAGVSTIPTVSTPGQRDAATGEWTHRDGGHWWFTAPADLPDSGAAFTTEGDDGYSVKFGNTYALLPPSTRPEGPYKATGMVEPLPDALRDTIVNYGRGRAERATGARSRGDGDPVTEWGRSVRWADLLTAAGWTATGRTSRCGCDEWTAPGPHGSAKSGTAHEPGCAEWADSPDPPLHIWTDHDAEPFECFRDGRAEFTVSRLQAVAVIDHGGDVGAAMDALDLHPDITRLALTEDDAAWLDSLRITPPHAASDAEAGSSGQGERRLRITWAGDIEPEPVKWLWVDITGHNLGIEMPPNSVAPDPYIVEDIALVPPGGSWTPPEVEFNGRIACGMLTVAAGREGTGKSSFAIWLAANITRGTLPGLHYRMARPVFYVATEDSWKHTLVPRLIAAGADMMKVARIEAETHESATVTVSLPDDIPLLTTAIREHGVAMVVVDPLMSTLGSGLNANDSKEVRSALEPLARMADETGASVIGIAHFNKATGLDAASRITGSGAFKDVARAVMVFARGDDDERVFSQPKNSVGSSDLPSLTYSITPAVVETPKGKAATARFAFTGMADRSVDDGLRDEHRGAGKPQASKSPVEQFIVDYIREHSDTDTGEVPAADVIAAGATAGFSENQMKKARPRITDPVVDFRRGGFGGGSVWKLAGDDRR